MFKFWASICPNLELLLHLFVQILDFYLKKKKKKINLKKKIIIR
ncbi:hypothetical protein NC653_037449 [Populus alba x Populus x berolinensis]|uniref:Uncharacterized protein n=1 Tax=Populus alba x Populus x berolinensis TaxID=444605 RepID=A0AAD6LEL7_9ROSI|nr:hypothetical protein NC653_037446 [Populus alba x Populus x berolinensis]KAJ6959153.1 hypothetical protein NC653_037449 [Populus alba x Populus x berolinensis]